MKKTNPAYALFPVFCFLFLQLITPGLGFGCEVNITYPEENAVITVSPVVITGTLEADVEEGDAYIEVLNNNERQWFLSGTFNQARELLEGGAVTVTLALGENFIEVKGSGPGCSVYDSVTIIYDQCPDNPDKLELGDCGCAADIISITPSADNLIPGETATVNSRTENPSGGELNWSVSRVSGNASAAVTPAVGTSTTLTNVSGEGLLRIRGANAGCHKEYIIHVGCEKCDGSQCGQIGEGDPGLDSIGMSFSLGRTGDGRRAGSILLLAESTDPLNATPRILQYNSFNSDSEVPWDGDALRQVVAPEGFVNIVTTDAYSYHIDFYAPEDRGPKNGDFYEPAAGAQPFVTWTIENPDASPTVYNRLRLTKTRDGSETVHEYQWDDSTQTWSLSKGGGLQIISRREEINTNGDRVITETVKNNLDDIAAVTQTVWHTFPWGDELISETNDPDNYALTTVYEYYETTGADGYSLPKSVLNPDGSWEKYEYDAHGRKTAVIKAWLDAPITSAADQAVAVYHDYTPVDASDSDLPEDTVRPRQVTEMTLGIITAKTFYLYAKDAVTGKRTAITERAVRPDAVWGDADNLRTVTVTHAHTFTTPESGKTESVTWPDNRKDSYAYEYGTYTPAGTLPGTFVPGGGEDIRTTVTRGTADSPGGIAYKTLREITVSSELGDTLLEESRVFTGAGYKMISQTVRKYDDVGHETGVYHSSGAVKETSWDCCHKESATDTRGIVTEFVQYDALERLKTSVRTGHNGTADIITDRTFDAMGRALSKTVSGGSLSLSTSSGYDTAGRLAQTTDPAGLTTTYTYSANTLIRTVTRPGDATEINARYPDGQLKSVTGTGAVARYHTHGVNADSTLWEVIHFGGPDSPRWEKRVTDMAGRVIRTEKPGFAGTEVTEISYDNLGREIKTEAPGRAASLRTYDEISRPLLTGLDTDANGLLEPNSADRIRKSVTTYVNTDSDWYLETVRSICAADNDPAFTITGKTLERLTGLGGGLVSETVTVDIHGNETVSQTFVNRTDRQETRIVTYPDATVQAMTVTENGLLRSARNKSGVTVTFGYDDLGRKTSYTDPRTGASLISYNTQGRIEYTQDPAGNRTVYGYCPDTGREISVTDALDKVRRTAYNDRGQTTHIWGDAVYPVKYVYDSYGQGTELHTFRAGTGWEGETWPDATTGLADITTFVYQEATGLFTAKQDAKGESVVYTYYPGGWPHTRTWARTHGGDPVVTTYSYDPDTAELTDTDYSDDTPDISYTYYRHGQPAAVTDGAGSRVFTYNDSLRPETETVTGLTDRTLTRDYDQIAVKGRVTGFHTDTGYAVTYGYEPDTGRFNSLAWDVNALTGTADYAYEPDSDLVRSLSAGGRLTEYGYETDRDLLATISNQHDTDLISRYGYQYDSLGRRKNRTVSGSLPRPGSTSFGYNDRGELISERKTAVNGELQPADVYTSNELNQYETITGLGTLNYDQDGNLIQKSGTVYTYNAENRLIEAAPQSPAEGDQKVEFIYDYMGRRVQKKVSGWQDSAYEHIYTSHYFYDGWNMIEEIRQHDGQMAQSHYYIWSLDLSGALQGAGGIGGLIATVRDSSAYQYFYDGNGNVTQLINNQGPDILTADDNPFRFSTKYFDAETGLYYYGYRYYDPELERWLSRDPIGEKGGNNLYLFVFNNPLSFVDTLGREVAHGVGDGFFENDDSIRIASASEIADAFDRGAYKSYENMEEGIKENPASMFVLIPLHGGIFIVQGCMDFLRLGEGSAKGGWGYVHDGLRVTAVLIPAARYIKYLKCAKCASKSGLQATKVTEKGIARIEKHLTKTPGIESGAAEFKMIERLKAGNRTPQDLRFYQHEIIESRMIKKTSKLHVDPVDAASDAHHRTLIKQDLYRPGYTEELYHPDAHSLLE